MLQDERRPLEYVAELKDSISMLKDEITCKNFIIDEQLSIIKRKISLESIQKPKQIQQYILPTTINLIMNTNYKTICCILIHRHHLKLILIMTLCNQGILK